MNTPRALLLAVFVAVAAAPALADKDQQALAKSCLTAIRAGKTAKAEAALGRILEWREVSDFVAIGSATVCFDETRGPGWKYSNQQSRFVDPVALAQEGPSVASGQICLAAVTAGDSAQVASWRARLLSWRNVFDTAAVTNARQCLDAMGDGPWIWHAPSGRFRIKAEADATDSRVAKARNEASAALRQAEERAKARLEEAATRTVRACYQLFRSDEIAALTNPVCSPIFLAQGLPE